jgi:hypothetical protein
MQCCNSIRYVPVRYYGQNKYQISWCDEKDLNETMYKENEYILKNALCTWCEIIQTAELTCYVNHTYHNSWLTINRNTNTISNALLKQQPFRTDDQLFNSKDRKIYRYHTYIWIILASMVVFYRQCSVTTVSSYLWNQHIEPSHLGMPCECKHILPLLDNKWKLENWRESARANCII